MSDLIDIDFDFKTGICRAEFDKYLVKCLIHLEEGISEKKDISVGIMEDRKCIDSFYYCWIDIFDDNLEKVKLSEKLIKEIKHEIENKIDQDYE